MNSFYFALVNRKNKNPYGAFLVGRGFVSHGGVTTPRAVETRKEVFSGRRGQWGRGQLETMPVAARSVGSPGRRTRPAAYVTRVRVRVSDTIRIGYTDTHFLKSKSTKMVYLSIRIRVSDEYRIRIHRPLEYPCNTRQQQTKPAAAREISGTNLIRPPSVSTCESRKVTGTGKDGSRPRRAWDQRGRQDNASPGRRCGNLWMICPAPLVAEDGPLSKIKKKPTIAFSFSTTSRWSFV